MKWIYKLMLSTIVMIVVFNLLMLSFIPFEKVLLPYRDEWLSQSMELSPKNIKNCRSVILVHGFVGSPNDMKELAESLRNYGFRVVIPLMPQQTLATFPYNRGNFTSADYVRWLADIVNREIKLTGRKPYLIGFSMGGTIATIVAKTDNIEKLVLIAPFFGLPQIGDSILSIMRILRYVIPIVPKVSKGQINNKEGYKKYFPGSYIISLAAFNRLCDLAIEARENITLIKKDILLIVSANDRVASYEKTIDAFAANGHVAIRRYDNSNHILLYDYDAKSITKTIIDFIGDRSANADRQIKGPLLK